ncbi:MAG: putative toxin-antitoxin system toxin component, PIN family [Proteobacteria bacterium]|nr:putative toxin-antitoxin system toxin component, PIN family [Pseudomonadota bacterium]
MGTRSSTTRPVSPPRLVLDINVVLSALLFSSGAIAWLRREWQAKTIQPLASRETTMELIRVLAYPKFRLTEDEREDLLGDILPLCETVTVPEGIGVPECRDPLDRPFLELAVAAEADWLVTGDKDLLDLASNFSVLIVTPASLRDILVKRRIIPR